MMYTRTKRFFFCCCTEIVYWLTLTFESFMFWRKKCELRNVQSALKIHFIAYVIYFIECHFCFLAIFIALIIFITARNTLRSFVNVA